MGGVGNGVEDVVGVEEAFVGEAAGTEILLHRSMKTLSLLVGDGGWGGANFFAEGDVVEVACHKILQDRVGRMKTAG